MYDDQGYGQVKLFMKFWRSPDSIPGKLLRITMAWNQFCAGIGAPILVDTATILPHLEAKWTVSLRTFLKDVSSTIQLDDPFIAPLQRKHDAFIMDIAIHSGKFTAAELRRLNYCCMHLNVLLLSDIATANGKEIDATMYNGQADEAESLNNFHKVNQP